MDWQNEACTEIWKLYQKGVDYFNRQNLYSKTEEAYRFFLGDQWHGLESGGERMPVMNVIQPTVEYKVATVAQNNMSIHYSSMRPGSGEEEREVCELLDANAARQWELRKMDRMCWDVVKDACISGDAYVFFYDGEGNAPLIGNTDVYLSDEQCPDLQKQKYIILAERRFVSELREEAKKNGLTEDEIDLIQPDEPEHRTSDEERREVGEDEKCTSLLYMEKKDGVVHICRATRNVIYQKDTAVQSEDAEGNIAGKLTQYPIASLVWKRGRNSARGMGEVKELIPNQIEVNRLLARRLINAKITAFARLVYNGQMVENIDQLDEVGAAIEVQGGVSNVRDMVTYLNPAPMSGDAKELTDELITQTRELAGAGDAATGQVDPTQASGAAIVAVQEQAALPLNEQVAAFRQFVEDVASVWFAIWAAYNPNGLEVEIERDGMKQVEVIPAEVLQQMRVFIRIDVSPNNPYSKFAQEQAIQALFDSGAITFEEYVEALDDNASAPKAKLQEIIEKRQQAQEDQLQQAIGIIQQQQQTIQTMQQAMGGGAGNAVPVLPQ